MGWRSAELSESDDSKMNGRAHSIVSGEPAVINEGLRRLWACTGSSVLLSWCTTRFAGTCSDDFKLQIRYAGRRALHVVDRVHVQATDQETENGSHWRMVALHQRRVELRTACLVAG